MTEGRAPRLGPVLAAAALAMPAVVVASLVLATFVERLTPAAAGDRGEAARAWLVTLPGLGAQVATASAVLLAFAVVGAACSPSPWRARLSLARGSARAGDVVALTVALAAFGLAYGALSELLGVADRGTLARFAEAVRAAGPSELAAAFVFIALVPAVCEELFFRGFLLTRLGERLDARTASIASGVAFGAFHMDVRQGLAAAVMGTALARATLAFGSVRPAIAAHMANNALALAALALTPAERSRHGALAVATVAMLACVASTAYLVRAVKRAG